MGILNENLIPFVVDSIKKERRVFTYALIALDFFAIIISEKSSFKMTVQCIGDLC